VTKKSASQRERRRFSTEQNRVETRNDGIRIR
jgi:hypothetical protein